MDSNDNDVIDFNKKKEERKMEKDKEKKGFKRGLKVIAVTAVGAGLYGFSLGRKAGYDLGLQDGYNSAASDFIDIMKEFTEEIRLTRGE